MTTSATRDRGRRGDSTSADSRRVGGAPGDGGFVTVVVAGLLAVLVAVAGLVSALGAVAVVRHRAAAAADLAALAAAQHALDGEPAACAAAARVAQEQGARLDRCALRGDEAEVQAVVRPAGALGRWGEARSRARAGPAG